MEEDSRDADVPPWRCPRALHARCELTRIASSARAAPPVASVLSVVCVAPPAGAVFVVRAKETEGPASLAKAAAIARYSLQKVPNSCGCGRWRPLPACQRRTCAVLCVDNAQQTRLSSARVLVTSVKFGQTNGFMQVVLEGWNNIFVVFA